MKVKIMGTDYDYREIEPTADSRMAGLDGYCDGYEKKIRINKSLKGDFKSSPVAVKDYKQLVRRHEIIHGFLRESGLEQWNNDEMLVDYFATQFPKMLDAFRKVNGI